MSEVIKKYTTFLNRNKQGYWTVKEFALILTLSSTGTTVHKNISFIRRAIFANKIKTVRNQDFLNPLSALKWAEGSGFKLPPELIEKQQKASSKDAVDKLIKKYMNDIDIIYEFAKKNEKVRNEKQKNTGALHIIEDDVRKAFEDNTDRFKHLSNKDIVILSYGSDKPQLAIKGGILVNVIKNQIPTITTTPSDKLNSKELYARLNKIKKGV